MGVFQVFLMEISNEAIVMSMPEIGFPKKERKLI